ncbi:PepSY domain-containing protein [Romboutsia sp.]|uniref:PepSY domain-containing protein n=1 Tax=Romboutsia sp. TaxID=1965302 RepID=UPI003F3C5C22
MKKILVTIIIFSMSIFFVACNNSTTQKKAQPEGNDKITIEQAKEIALKHANLKSDQIKFVKEEKNIENSVEKYDIEFYHDNKEYDYEINVSTGEILEYDNEVEEYTIVQPSTSEKNSKITLEQAKEIALKHSNLANDQVEFIKEEKNSDNGIEKYEIDFYHNNIEYNYEIDANNGSVIEYEKGN